MALLDLGGFSSSDQETGMVDVSTNAGGNVYYAPFPALQGGGDSMERLAALALPAIAILGAVLLLRSGKK